MYHTKLHLIVILFPSQFYRLGLEEIVLVTKYMILTTEVFNPKSRPRLACTWHPLDQMSPPILTSLDIIYLAKVRHGPKNAKD